MTQSYDSKASIKDGLRFGTPGVDDRNSIVRLLGQQLFKETTWDWQFGRVPDRVQPVTAYFDDEVVGFNGTMPVVVLIDGERVPAVWSCDFVVASQYRRMGVGSAVKSELDRRSGFLMTLGTSEAAAHVLLRSGWQQGSGPSRYRKLRFANGYRSWPRALLQLPGQLLGQPGRLLANRITTTISDVLPDNRALDRLWKEVESTYRRCVVRDSEYLTWRYGSHPIADYQYICAWKDDELTGLAVIRKSSLRAFLVDYVGPGTDVSLKRALVSGFLEACDECIEIECTTSDRELISILLMSGFLPYSALRFFVRVNSASKPRSPSDGWFLMGGDSDGELLDAARSEIWRVSEWDEEQFASSRREWTALLEQSDADPLFMSWDWQYRWWKHFSSRHGLRLKLVVVHDNHARLAGIAPFFYHDVHTGGGYRIRRIEPLGNLWSGTPTMRTEYVGPILLAGFENDIARRLAKHLNRSCSWDELAIQDWNVSLRGSQAFIDEIQNGCLRVDKTRAEFDEARYASLEGGFSAYVSGLSANARRALLHRRRFLASLGSIRIDYAGPSDIATYFSNMNRLHAIRWGGAVFSGHRLAFHEDLAAGMAAEDRLRLSQLSLDGEVVSVLYNLRGESREYNLQAGFDDRLFASKMSLGLLHLGYSIEQAASDGIKAFDLLAGSGRKTLFKKRIATQANSFLRTRYFRSSRALVAYGLHRVRRSLRLD